MQKVQRKLQLQMQQLAAESAAQRNENYNLAEANRRQQSELNELRDPRRRMEELQRLVIEPAMQEILKGKLSAVEIQRMRAYRIDEAVVDKLLELRILPPGWKTNDLFGRAAFREDLPKAQQLPMSAIDRAVLQGETPAPENFPERARDYSRVSDTEWALLPKSSRDAINKANDSIQTSFAELKDLLFMCAALADDSVSAEQRCEMALGFAAVQSRFIFDEIAQCELRKMELAAIMLAGGQKVAIRTAERGPDLLGSDDRAKIDASNDAVKGVAAARKDWAAVSRGADTTAAKAAAEKDRIAKW